MRPQEESRQRLMPLVVVLVGGLLLGGGLVFVASHHGEPMPVPALLDGLPLQELATRTEIETLRVALEGEVAARRQLQEQIAQLREQVATRGVAGVLAGGPAAHADGAPADEARQAEPAKSDEESQPGFDAAGLSDAGMPAPDVERLHQRWEQFELDKLQVNDAALREGYFFTPRHRDAHVALAATFRQDVGEAGYDGYLYATGQPNRVLVAEVLAGSPASNAGFRPGDLIVSYDGHRTYSAAEVQLATGGGTLGEAIRVEVLRDGRVTTIDAARGPLGVILRPARRSPGSQ